MTHYLAASIHETGSIPAANVWYVTYAPYVLGYASFLALLMNVIEDGVLAAQAANIIFSGLSAVLIFLIAKKITNRADTAAIASLFWVIMPAIAAMVTLPATAPPYITLILAVLYLFLQARGQKFFWSGLALLISAFALLALLNEIRPLGVLAIAAGLVFLFVTNNLTTIKSARWLLIVVVFIGLFFLASAQLNRIKDQFLGVPVARNAYGFGLYLGLNYEMTGNFGVEDSRLFTQARDENTPAQAFHQDMIERSWVRFNGLFKNRQLLDLFVKKIALFWSNPNAFIIWTEASVEDKANINLLIRASARSSESLFGAIIFFALVESLLAYRRKGYFYHSRALLIKALLLMIFAMHIVFDINSRYIMPAIPLLFILAAGGIQAASELTASIQGMAASRGTASVKKSGAI